MTLDLLKNPFTIEISYWLYFKFNYLRVHYITQISSAIFVLSVFLLFTSQQTKDEQTLQIKKILFSICVFSFLIGPGAMIWLPNIAELLDSSGNWPKFPGFFAAHVDLPIGGYALAGGAGGGAWFGLRYPVAILNAARARLTKQTKVARDGKTDIRTVREMLPKTGKDYDPRRYFQ
jgi:hypothetical protein